MCNKAALSRATRFHCHGLARLLLLGIGDDKWLVRVASGAHCRVLGRQLQHASDRSLERRGVVHGFDHAPHLGHEHGMALAAALPDGLCNLPAQFPGAQLGLQRPAGVVASLGAVHVGSVK